MNAPFHDSGSQETPPAKFQPPVSSTPAGPPSSPSLPGPIAAGLPDCAASDAALQTLLDGLGEDEAASVVNHRRNCDRCRSYHKAALRLLNGLRPAQPADLAPADLADRVLRRWRDEQTIWRHRRGRLLAAGLAAAAGLLIAIVVLDHGKSRDTSRPDAAPPVVNKPVPPVQLQDSIDEAASAVTALTRKTREDALGVKLPTLTFRPSGPLERLEPAAASMQHMGHNAVYSVAPMTDSAKRAADLIWREVVPD